jgi:hypothetical protein
MIRVRSDDVSTMLNQNDGTETNRRIAEAQQRRTCRTAGAKFARVRHDNETDDWGANKGPCSDYGVTRGMFHVTGCDVERCPKCGGQAVTCDCQDEG